MTDKTQTPSITDRITAYLSGGGLFNPELANHDAVRDLLIDCRAELAAAEAKRVEVMQQLLFDIESANAMVGAEKLSGNVVKEAHAMGESVGLRISLEYLRVAFSEIKE